MTKKVIGLTLCGTSLLLACNHNTKINPQKPNIIYFYFDDLGYGELGCYGQEKIRTPNIDRLADEGIKFTQHYTTFPVSAPARCGLLTGKHSGHSFIRGNYEMGGFGDDLEGGQMPLPDGTFTIGKLMQQAGYKTGAIGKWGLGMNFTTGCPENQGFDYFYGYLDQKQAHNYYPTHLWENEKRIILGNEYFPSHAQIKEDALDSEFEKFIGKEYSIDKMTEKTLDFIRDNKNKPFFLYLPFVTPHVSLQAPADAVQEYVGQFQEEPYLGNQGYVPCKYPLSTYAAMITYTDKQIGRIMELIKELGLDENTIFMLSSDNGTTFNGGVNREFFNSTAGLKGCKMDLYEGGISIPFIARWPGKIKAGQKTDLISVQYDLFATLSELTQIKSNWSTDGISFLPTLLSQPEQQKNHEYLYFEYPENGGQIAVIKDGWKGIRRNVKKGETAWEVYNLQNDRKETSNMAASQSSKIQEFEKIIQKEHQNATTNEWEFINSKIVKKTN